MKTTRARKERILVYGAAKSGKSRCWTSLAEHGNKVNVLDLDFRAPQSSDHLTDDELKNVSIYQPKTWEELVNMTMVIQVNIKPDQWLVVDHITQAWSFVQQYYIEQVMGNKPHDFFLEFKKGGGKGNPLQGGYGENWNVINALYKDWMVGSILRTPGHVMGIAQTKKLDSEKPEEVSIVKMFGRFGYKPEGQKELPYQFDSIILTGFGSGIKSFTLNTCGDTNREWMVDKEHGDFGVDYLCGVGGWSL